MEYNFNYGFLRKFKEEYGLTQNDMLKAFGTQDYGSIKKWINGYVPIHIVGIMRFCNYFGIDISNFFFCEDAPKYPMPFRAPKMDEQILPTPKELTDKEKAKLSADEILEEEENRRSGQRMLDPRVRSREDMSANARNAIISIAKKRTERTSMWLDASQGRSLSPTLPQSNADPTESLRLRLAHMEEIQRIKDEQRQREDEIRKEYKAEMEQMRSQYEATIEQMKARIDGYERGKGATRGYEYGAMAAESH